MKIKELIKQLKKFNPESEIYQSIDSEGNAIKVIYNVAMYELGDLVPDENGDIEIRKGEKYRWVSKGQVPVIWPTDEIISN